METKILDYDGVEKVYIRLVCLQSAMQILMDGVKTAPYQDALFCFIDCAEYLANDLAELLENASSITLHEEAERSTSEFMPAKTVGDSKNHGGSQ